MSTTNQFIQKGLEISSTTISENGAKKYSQMENVFATQFGSLGDMGRTVKEVERDCRILWSENPLKALKFNTYVRMIARDTKLNNVMFNGSKGAELKKEGIERLYWLATNHKETFVKNLPLFVAIGSFKDIFIILNKDLEMNGWDNRQIDWKAVGSFIKEALNDPNQADLVKKYLPTIKSKRSRGGSSVETVYQKNKVAIAKWLASQLFGKSEPLKQYRKLKSSGNAHEWQKMVSQKQFKEINFDTIGGKAMTNLMGGGTFNKWGLSAELNDWIGAKQKNQETIKATGFVHEILNQAQNEPTKEQIDIMNLQFEELIKKQSEKTNNTNLIVVRDTSSSMESLAYSQYNCNHIAKSLAIYFSEFLKGKFANSWIEFNSEAKMHTWIGNTAVDKYINDNSQYYGSTNFQSVIDLLCQIKQSGVPESEFPSGLLLISDCEFDKSNLPNTNNLEEMKLKLAQHFSQEYVDNFVMVFWNLQRGQNVKFENYRTLKNVFYFSGFSASTISFLTENIKTIDEVIEKALNQDILNQLQL